MVYKTMSYCLVCGHNTHFVIRRMQTVDSSKMNTLLFELVLFQQKALRLNICNNSAFFSGSLDSPEKKTTDVIPNDSLGWMHNSTVSSCHRNVSKIFSCRGFSAWTPQNNRTISNFKFQSPQLFKFPANRAWFGEQIGSWTKSQYPGDSSTFPVPCARQLPSESWGSQQQLVGHNICLSHKPAAGFISLCFVCSSASFEHFSRSRFRGFLAHFCNEPWSSFNEKKQTRWSFEGRVLVPFLSFKEFWRTWFISNLAR